MSIVTMATGLYLITFMKADAAFVLTGAGLITTVVTAWFVPGAAKQVATNVSDQIAAQPTSVAQNAVQMAANAVQTAANAVQAAGVTTTTTSTPVAPTAAPVAPTAAPVANQIGSIIPPEAVTQIISLLTGGK
jgi:hypothetical protein